MNILISVDDSKHSRQAVDFALRRRWRSGSKIIVITAIDAQEIPSTPDSVELLMHTGSSTAGRGTELYRNTVAYLERIVSQAARRFSQTCKNVDVEYQVLSGYPKEAILEFSSRWPADLVILGSHGRRGLSRILLGSVSQSILLYGDCSTLIVRSQKEKPKTKNATDVENILLAVDPSQHSEQALEYVLSMPWSNTACFKLLTIAKPAISKYQDGISALNTKSYSIETLAEYERCSLYLRECQERFEEKFSKNRVSAVLTEGDPGDCILNVAAAWPAELIVMGSRGHGSIARLWLGSVSQEVVLQAKCPVEVIKSRATNQ